MDAGFSSFRCVRWNHTFKKLFYDGVSYFFLNFTDSNALEFKQDVVPYNTLSGYEDPPENPGLFPRPLGLGSRGPVGTVETWNILIRGRWCIQANG